MKREYEEIPWRWEQAEARPERSPTPEELDPEFDRGLDLRNRWQRKALMREAGFSQADIVVGKESVAALEGLILQRRRTGMPVSPALIQWAKEQSDARVAARVAKTQAEMAAWRHRRTVRAENKAKRIAAAKKQG